MFIDENIPSNFKNIAEVSDNYIVLVKENTLVSGRTYEAYYQFFNPSTQILYVNNYKIKTGDSATFDVSYINTQYYSYIDDITPNYSLTTSELVVDRDNEAGFFNRPDINNIFIGIGFFLAIYILIWNLASSLVHRGGIFHA